MSYNNGRITAPVSVYDVQRALGVSSGDVATLCTHQRINPWARYRPIPCINSNNNTHKPITLQQRASERYGTMEITDSFTADDIQVLENYANSIDSGSGLRIKPWRDDMWLRLTDFVKTDDNGRPVNGVGYDHRARCGWIKVSKETEEYTISPLIPVEQRDDIIVPNTQEIKYPFPNENDKNFLIGYKKYIDGDAGGYVVTLENEEWLTIADLIAGNEYAAPLDANSVVRGVAIFKQEGNAAHGNYEWKYVARTALNPDEPNEFFNLSDDSTVLYGTSYGIESLEDLGSEQGDDYLFVETWGLRYQDGSNFGYPIPGLAYTVKITRTQTAGGRVDIDGVLTFRYVTRDGKLYFRVKGSSLDSAGSMLSLLRQNYTSISLMSGGVTADLLNSAMQYTVDAYGDWRSGWTQIYTPSQDEEQITLNATKIGGLQCQQILQITTSE